MPKNKGRFLIILSSLFILMAVILTGCGDSRFQKDRGAVVLPENSGGARAGEEVNTRKSSLPATAPQSKQESNPGQKQKPSDSQVPVVRRPAEAGFYERQDSQGEVAVDVIWLTPEYLQARGLKMTPEQEQDLSANLVFNLALTTHSGDLRDFDFAEAIRLKVNGRDAGPGSWEFVNRDGHHPEGMIRFMAPGNEPPRELTLSINNLSGVPVREFKWQL
ncbi:Uncharacterized [Moorella glycerini]|uniref:Uncharacterized protein n=1 Tax=Neomoorella stamsii TaxID=1266720 RepID=A0A9X7J0U4_9FIRM|nr:MULTISPECIES: hypothetical protein [Moorella]PRR68886.1 hypothetical protein MOST_31680 [Moorella stamsii]CEP67507.1 Uncharacterized [Moorella glycerini]